MWRIDQHLGHASIYHSEHDSPKNSDESGENGVMYSSPCGACVCMCSFESDSTSVGSHAYHLHACLSRSLTKSLFGHANLHTREVPKSPEDDRRIAQRPLLYSSCTRFCFRRHMQLGHTVSVHRFTKHLNCCVWLAPHMRHLCARVCMSSTLL